MSELIPILNYLRVSSPQQRADDKHSIAGQYDLNVSRVRRQKIWDRSGDLLRDTSAPSLERIDG